MILNHNDNHALFLHTIDHGEYKPLMDAYGELLTTINHLAIDGETRSKLFELATNAVERAEDNAFDKAAELQAAITTDELTDREEDEEAPEVSVLAVDQANSGLRAHLVYDTASNPSTDDISAQLPDYFGGCKPIDVEGFGIDPSGGIVLQFHDKPKAKAPTMELQIMPRLNADGFPVLAVCTYVPTKK